MTESMTIFLIIGSVGFLFLLVSFVVGDLFDMIGLGFDAFGQRTRLRCVKTISRLILQSSGFQFFNCQKDQTFAPG